MNRRSLLRFMVVVLLLLPMTVLANPVDWRGYEKLLKTYVSQGEINATSLAVVDYSGIKNDALYKALLTELAHADVSLLESRQDKIAFYINVYNIFAIKMVLDHWPLASIRDAGSFFAPVWKKPVGILGGRSVTLDEIEHKILRGFGEPRIHFAIVCASVSCPDLLNEPYLAASLDRQLNQQTTLFLNNRVKGLRINKDKVEVSKIFDWFEEDFAGSGGIAGFVRSYRPEISSQQKVVANIEYDWLLNGR